MLLMLDRLSPQFIPILASQQFFNLFLDKHKLI